MSPVLGLLLACSLGAEGRLDLDLAADARGRWMDPASPSDAHAVDLTTAPRAVLGIRSGASDFSIGYAPRFTVRDIGPDHRYETIHEGEARVRLAPGARWALELSGGATRGRTDQVTVNRSAPDASQTSTVSTTAPLDLQSETAGLRLRLAGDTRNEVLVTLDGSEGGGTNPASRAAMPLARGVSGAVEYGWRATPRDRVFLRATAEAFELPDQRIQSRIASARTGWEHRATPDVLVRAAAGAVTFYTSASGAPDTMGRAFERHVKPAAELRLMLGGLRGGAPQPSAGPGQIHVGLAQPGPGGEQQPTARAPASPPEGTASSGPAEAPSGAAPRASGAAPNIAEAARAVSPAFADLGAYLGASVDRITGVATQESGATATLGWPIARTVELDAGARGVYTWTPGGFRTRRAGVDLGVTQKWAGGVALSLGAYADWQRSNAPGAATFAEYGAVLRLGWEALRLKF